jgi:hypothetical protein
MLILRRLSYFHGRRPRLSLLLIFSLSTLVSLLDSPRILASPATSESKIPCQLDADDRAVYAAVLKDPDVWRLPVNSVSTQPFTLAPRKSEWDKPDRPFGAAAQKFLHEASDQTRADFAAKSTSGCLVGTLPQKVLDRATTPQPGSGNPAASTPPNRRALYWEGRITLSRIGFNSAKTEAIVYTESSCGNSCGGGDLFLLRRVDGAWTIINQINLWEL